MLSIKVVPILLFAKGPKTHLIDVNVRSIWHSQRYKLEPPAAEMSPLSHSLLVMINSRRHFHLLSLAYRSA